MPTPSLPLAAVAVAVVYVVLVAVAQLLRRVRGVPLGGGYHLFALASGLLTGAHLLPPGGPGWQAEVLKHLTAAVVVLAAIPVAAILNRTLWGVGAATTAAPRTAPPRVMVDITGGAALLVAVLATLQFVYNIAVPGLVAGSGVAAVILGLAMQDLLSNLLAGFSLYFEKPFKTGDWLLLDGHHAKVIEISWRSTQLLTVDEVLIDVPNNTICKQTITNFERPTPRHAVRAQIGLHYNVPPMQAQEVLKTAAASVPGVCASPSPAVFIRDFGDSAVVYEIKVYIEDHSIHLRVLSDVRTHCWYALQRAGFEIPYPQLTLHRAPPPDDGGAPRARASAALLRHPVFGFLAEAQVDALMRGSALVRYARNEVVIAQGAPGESMFLLVRGQVEVRITRDGRTAPVAQLGPDGCFGEMSLLTGEPRSATVVALSEVEAIEIRKPEFAALVHTNPAVLERLTELLVQRQLANVQHTAALAGRTPEQVRSGLRDKLRAFFQLGG